MCSHPVNKTPLSNTELFLWFQPNTAYHGNPRMVQDQIEKGVQWEMTGEQHCIIIHNEHETNFAFQKA
jgi:hypothetical protein